MGKIGKYNVTLQRYDNGKKSSVLIAKNIVGTEHDDENVKIRAMRELNVKENKRTEWRFVSKELIQHLGI